MTQDERFNAALSSVSASIAWKHLIADERFTDEMAQLEANADHRTSRQQNRIEEAQNDSRL
ncbi:hypothetical protein ACMV8I_18830 [Ewingella sp. S1.OA.A_B6]